jgi:membrane protein implicated in regulation of membrane protease activity
VSETSAIIGALGVWTWFVLGTVLLLLELVAPGAIFLWFGIAAFAVGVLAMAITLPWQLQILVFAALSLVLVFVYRRYFRARTEESDRPFLNNRGEAVIGQSFVLTDAINQGRGKIRIGDTDWRVSGPDLPKGERVTVTGVDGALLQVIKAG